MGLFAFDEDARYLIQISAWLVGSIFLLGYLFKPWWMYIHLRIRSQPTVELIDWQNYPIPVAFRERVERDGNELRALGFRPLLAYLVNINGGNSDTISFLFFNPQTQDSAEVSGILVPSNTGFILRGLFTTVGSRFALEDHAALRTSNMDAVVNFGHRANDQVFLFPHVKKVNQLLELHDRLRDRHYSNIPKCDDGRYQTENAFLSFALERYRKIIEDWAQSGKIKPVANETDYRYRAATIYQLCWLSWLPLMPIAKWLRYRRSRRAARELLRQSA